MRTTTLFGCVNPLQSADLTLHINAFCGESLRNSIEKIIIEIDRGFLGLYLIPTTSQQQIQSLERRVIEGREAEKRLAAKS